MQLLKSLSIELIHISPLSDVLGIFEMHFCTYLALGCSAISVLPLSALPYVLMTLYSFTFVQLYFVGWLCSWWEYFWEMHPYSNWISACSHFVRKPTGKISDFVTLCWCCGLQLLNLFGSGSCIRCWRFSIIQTWTSQGSMPSEY